MYVWMMSEQGRYMSSDTITVDSAVGKILVMFNV